MKILRTSGPFRYRERDAGGYVVEEDYTVWWEGGPSLYAVLADGTGQVFGRSAAIRKGFTFDGASGTVDELLAAYGLHDLWYRLHRQKVNGKRRLALRYRWVGDLLMHLLHLRFGMSWLYAKGVYLACRVGGLWRATRPDKEAIVITEPA